MTDEELQPLSQKFYERRGSSTVCCEDSAAIYHREYSDQQQRKRQVEWCPIGTSVGLE